MKLLLVLAMFLLASPLSALAAGTNAGGDNLAAGVAPSAGCTEVLQKGTVNNMDNELKLDKQPPKITYQAENQFMQLAIEEARMGIYNGHGGPFGSVIVKDGKVIAGGHNHVVSNNDPTCHGEIDAIRKACAKLNTFDLSGYEIYTTGEPCHMCLTACMWANLDKVYYGCTIVDNAIIGFRDEKFDKIFGGRKKLKDLLKPLDREACLKLFEEYNKLDHTQY